MLKGCKAYFSLFGMLVFSVNRRLCAGFSRIVAWIRHAVAKFLLHSHRRIIVADTQPQTYHTNSPQGQKKS